MQEHSELKGVYSGSPHTGLRLPAVVLDRGATSTVEAERSQLSCLVPGHLEAKGECQKHDSANDRPFAKTIAHKRSGPNAVAA